MNTDLEKLIDIIEKLRIDLSYTNQIRNNYIQDLVQYTKDLIEDNNNLNATLKHYESITKNNNSI